MKTEKSQLAFYGGKPVRKSAPAQTVVCGDREAAAVARVLKTGRISALTNDVVERFERDFADYCGVKHAVAVNSGTAALHVALAALDIGPGDEVIVPPYTFIATASAVMQQNAVPVFADIDPETLNINASEIEKKITTSTKAIIPVHLFGLPADMKAINRVARARKIPVIEDACQSHGATFGGAKVGGLGVMGCFSFQESKNITAGEGGAIVTNSAALAKKCRIIRHIGMAKKYQYVSLGYNYRMHALGAAFAGAQLEKLDSFNAHRREMAAIYRERLAGLPLRMIEEQAGCVSANHLFPVILDPDIVRRGGGMKKICAMIAAENVPVSWVYPEPLYNVEYIRDKKAHGKKCPFDCPHRSAPAEYAANSCPQAEDIAGRTATLFTAPCFSKAVAADSARALEKVLGFLKR